MFKLGTAGIIAFFTLTTPSYSDEHKSLITIRGLNVDSSVQEIEALLGACKPGKEPGSFTCGDTIDDTIFSGYTFERNGSNKIGWLTISCTFINGCEYSQGDLARLLSESLSLSDPELIIADEPDWGIFMDGPAGDRLIVNSPKRFSVTISAYNYRKPRLTLD